MIKFCILMFSKWKDEISKQLLILMCILYKNVSLKCLTGSTNLQVVSKKKLKKNGLATLDEYPYSLIWIPCHYHPSNRL